jgi:ABC-type transport system involved in multi-copper enzyme maturation permease subunit
MVGSLFLQEMVFASRRARHQVLRWIYGGWLVSELLWSTLTAIVTLLDQEEPGCLTTAASSHFFQIFLLQHLVLTVLATPAFVAGAISDEKTRGTLQYLLATELTSGQIVVGKLLARMVQVLILALVGLPLLCLTCAFAGLSGLVILALGVVTVGLVAGVASATLLAAVWTRHTRDAVLALLAVAVVLALLVRFLGHPLDVFSPWFMLMPVLEEGRKATGPELFRRLLLGSVAWFGFSAVCLGLAIWRLRPAYLRQLEGEGRSRGLPWWRGNRPPVSDQPIRWKERQVEGLAPVQALNRLPRGMGVATVAVATLVSSCLILWFHRAPGVTGARLLTLVTMGDVPGLASVFLPAGDAFWWQGVLALLLFSLLISVRCSGSVSGERERQTWEALLLTPLPEAQLIRGKLWGILGACYLYLLAYALPAGLFSFLGGGLAFFWVLLWLAVTLLAMYYAGAAGMWSSVRSSSSWRSLLSTLGWGYVGGFVVFLCTIPLIFLVTIFVYMALVLIDQLGTSLAPTTGTGFAQYMATVTISVCLALAFLFWAGSRFFLHYAQKWVAERDRTRHWHEEPITRRRRVVRRRLGRR